MHLWVHILLKATHSGFSADFKGETIFLTPGQFISGRKQLATETGLTQQQVRTIVNRLKIDQQINQLDSRKGSVFTVINWLSYQKSTNTSTNDQPTSNQPPTNDQPLNNKVKKEDNENKVNKNNPLTPKGDDDISPKELKKSQTKEKKAQEEKKFGDEFLGWWPTRECKGARDSRSKAKAKYIKCRISNCSHEDILGKLMSIWETNDRNPQFYTIENYIKPDDVHDWVEQGRKSHVNEQKPNNFKGKKDPESTLNYYDEMLNGKTNDASNSEIQADIISINDQEGVKSYTDIEETPTNEPLVIPTNGVDSRPINEGN